MHLSSSAAYEQTALIEQRKQRYHTEGYRCFADIRGIARKIFARAMVLMRM